MTYWRMQLHPDDGDLAAQHAYESLTAGFIGLDFRADVGDLMQTQQSQLPEGQRDYWAFGHEMSVGDRVLIIAHHFPLLSLRLRETTTIFDGPNPRSECGSGTSVASRTFGTTLTGLRTLLRGSRSR
jgi:hypothetical protein